MSELTAEVPRKPGTPGASKNVLLIGQSGSGKTALACRACDPSAPLPTERLTTIGVDYKRTAVEVEGESVCLQLWDSSGQERFSHIIRPYYKSCNGLLVCFDVTDRQSFEWVTSAAVQESILTHVARHTAIMLVGNKTDRTDRAVPMGEARKLALSLGWGFLETSALHNVNVHDALSNITREIMRREQEERTKDGTPSHRAASPINSPNHRRRNSWVAKEPTPRIAPKDTSLSGRWASLWEAAAACCGCVPMEELPNEPSTRPPAIVVQPAEGTNGGDKARSPVQGGVKPTPA